MKTPLRFVSLGAGAGLVALMLSPTSTTPALAQTPGVLALLEQLQASVGALQERVNGLIASDEANTRVTPAVLLVEGTLRCTVVNVAEEPRTIVAQVVDADTAEIVRERTGTFPPRRVDFIAVADTILTGRGYCQFTVIDGTRKDIRGSIELVGPPPVQLAAE
jgi:hypothetical protein